MLEAKLPPPNPASAAITRNIQYGVVGLLTAIPRPMAGMSSNSALTTVKLRPPNLAGPNVYGIRSTDPIRFGRATSQNNWSVVNS